VLPGAAERETVPRTSGSPPSSRASSPRMPSTSGRVVPPLRRIFVKGRSQQGRFDWKLANVFCYGINGTGKKAAVTGKM
jgi:hypothetical protein